VTVCSAAETLSFLFFVKVFLDHTGMWREEGSAHA